MPNEVVLKIRLHCISVMGAVNNIHVSQDGKAGQIFIRGEVWDEDEQDARLETLQTVELPEGWKWNTGTKMLGKTDIPQEIVLHIVPN